MSIARRTSIAIIGGGIGGLTAAASLLHAGFDANVYEQAKALGEVGAGINIGPNASRILHRLGIAEVLGGTGIKPVTFDQRRWDDGRILLRRANVIPSTPGALLSALRQDLSRGHPRPRLSARALQCGCDHQSPSPHHLQKRTRSRGPLLRRHYSASTLLLPCPTPAVTTA
jgi:2-polyprenyl-6-methoxyphenol hydroxylase-like FAD-dependent oxidoreductase